VYERDIASERWRDEKTDRKRKSWMTHMYLRGWWEAITKW